MNTSDQELAPYSVPVRPPFFGLVYGPPNTGKTRMLQNIASKSIVPSLLFTDSDSSLLQRHSPQLPLQENLRIVPLPKDLEAIETLIKASAVRFVVVDPFRSDVDALKVATLCRSLSVSLLGSLYSIRFPKGGSPTPIQAADLVIRVKGGRWRLEKNRFGALGSGSVNELPNIEE